VVAAAHCKPGYEMTLGVLDRLAVIST